MDDRFGRRPLLLTGVVGVTVSLGAVGLSFAALEARPESATSTTAGGIIRVMALVVFIASFGAISVATAANWLAAFLVAQFFLSVVDAIGESATFFIFAALCVVSFVFVWYLVPETKGRSPEEIQERWVRNGDRMLDERDLLPPPAGPGDAVPA